VIVMAIAPYGPVQRLLAIRPLVWLGTISYGVYLIHWPVFVWLNPENTGWSYDALFVPRMAITIGLAVLSYRLLETPIRKGGTLGKVRLRALAPVVAGATAILVIAVSINAPQQLIDFESAQAQVNEATADVPPASAPAAAATPTPPFPRIAVFGDSTGVMTAIGLRDYSQETSTFHYVPGQATLGCGIGRGGNRRGVGPDGKVETSATSPICDDWYNSWYQAIEQYEPTIAIVMVGSWDVTDRQLPGDSTWRTVGDPVYDRFLEGELDAAVRRLSSDGALVIVMTTATVGPDADGRDPVTAHGPAAEPQRIVRLNQIINDLPARNPGLVQVVDLASWLASTGEDRRLRPDGVHFSEPTATEVSRRYLVDAVLETYDDSWPARVAAGGGVSSSSPSSSAPPSTAGQASTGRASTGQPSAGTS
jgi:hypothetical protein